MGRTSEALFKDEDTVIEKKMYRATFSQNRSFELSIGRKMFFFEPYSSNDLTEEEINHSDFKQQSEYFSVKEI